MSSSVFMSVPAIGVVLVFFWSPWLHCCRADCVGDGPCRCVMSDGTGTVDVSSLGNQDGTARTTEFSSAWTIRGLSRVLQHKVISVYPPENGPCDETVVILTIEFGFFQHELPLSILWMGPIKGKGKMWLPNLSLGWCLWWFCYDDDLLNDDGNVYEVDTGVDDDYADNENTDIDSDTGDDDEEEINKVTSSPVVLHDGERQRQRMKFVILTT
ncbi:hypothetical protein PoB_004121100 [Plakobranchus ocellatus]|uniref:Uncharacterized protein n=1 Tax=Plakobranchus ocellatus TaxID=259542 RepID=A0AAV4B2F5_9GAST|nr:hypothetical protein PoB_004121100 [Plakobranchus ocellatus]